MVGMAVAKSISKEGSNYNKSGFYYYVAGGSLYGDKGKNTSFNGQSGGYTAGTIYGLHYDKKKKKIMVYKNGVLLGVGWEGVTDDLSPCCDFSEPKSKIEIVKGKFKNK
jgi:hypothetical protein